MTAIAAMVMRHATTVHKRKERLRLGRTMFREKSMLTHTEREDEAKRQRHPIIIITIISEAIISLR